jgi:hypothetical protein
MQIIAKSGAQNRDSLCLQVGVFLVKIIMFIHQVNAVIFNQFSKGILNRIYRNSKVFHHLNVDKSLSTQM